MSADNPSNQPRDRRMAPSGHAMPPTGMRARVGNAMAGGLLVIASLALFPHVAADCVPDVAAVNLSGLGPPQNPAQAFPQPLPASGNQFLALAAETEGGSVTQTPPEAGQTGWVNGNAEGSHSENVDAGTMHADSHSHSDGDVVSARAVSAVWDQSVRLEGVESASATITFIASGTGMAGWSKTGMCSQTQGSGSASVVGGAQIQVLVPDGWATVGDASFGVIVSQPSGAKNVGSIGGTITFFGTMYAGYDYHGLFRVTADSSAGNSVDASSSGDLTANSIEWSVGEGTLREV